jgi:hypothetical protein
MSDPFAEPCSKPTWNIESGTGVITLLGRRGIAAGSSAKTHAAFARLLPQPAQRSWRCQQGLSRTPSKNAAIHDLF